MDLNKEEMIFRWINRFGWKRGKAGTTPRNIELKRKDKKNCSFVREV